MKHIHIKKFAESRRSQDGHVEIRVEDSSGEPLMIGFTPEVSEQVLWAILSTEGQKYANEWKLWPLHPDHMMRALRSDGTMDLTFAQQQQVAFPVRISPDLREALLRALTQEAGPSKDPKQAH